MKTAQAAAPRPGRRPVDHEGLLTAKASRVLKVLSPEARQRFLNYVMALDQELRNSEQVGANTGRRKAG